MKHIAQTTIIRLANISNREISNEAFGEISSKATNNKSERNHHKVN